VGTSERDDDLSDTAQGELQAASIGSLGIPADLAARCGQALSAWEAAKRERADRERE